MSILSSTKTGYKYYYGTEVLNGYCKVLINNKESEMFTEIDEHKNISVLIPDNSKELLLTSQIISINESTEWLFNKEDPPIKMFRFLKPNMDCIFVIEKDFTKDKHIYFSEIQMPIKINCEISDFSCFRNCKIMGYIQSEIYSCDDLIGKHITPYFGKDILGF